MTNLPTPDQVKAYFPDFRICRLRVFTALLYCIITKSTVNLNKCKKAFGRGLGDPTIDLENAYRRLTRFFLMKNVLSFCLGISYMVLATVLEGQCAAYLAIDRTNWQIGKKPHKVNINILVIGLVLENGCFIPLVWDMLDKRGNSNQKERIDLIKRLVELITPIKEGHSFTFLGDREFVGNKWFKALVKSGFNFVMRLRKSDYLAAVALSNNTTIDKLQRKIKQKIKKQGFFFSSVKLEGGEYYYIVLPNTKKNAKDEWIRFLTDIPNVDTVSKAYRERWQIEVFFKHCKTNGYNLEELNMKNSKKAMLMMSIVSYAYVLAIREGIIKERSRPVKEQYYANGGKTYRRVSIFTQGYEILEQKILDMNCLVDLMQQTIAKLPEINRALLLKYFMKEHLV